MASYNELLALIDAYINRNGVQAITGQILNGVLKAMVEQLGRGYTLMGYAEPTGDPGTPDGPESWFASVPGTYTNYGEIQVAAGELALLSFAPSEGWTKNTIYEGFREVTATADDNIGFPQVGVTYANGVLSFDFKNIKGEPGENGDPAGFGSVTASVDDQVGTPSVSVSSSGPDTAKNFAFAFHNLKGETGVTSVLATVDNTSGNPQCSVSLQGGQLTLAFTGLKGAQGNTGSSVDYPFTIANNLTTNDATQALSAAMGVQLESEVSQLEAKVDGLEDAVNGDTYSGAGMQDAVAKKWVNDNGKVAKIASSWYTIKPIPVVPGVLVDYTITNPGLTGPILLIADSEDNVLAEYSTNSGTGIVVPALGARLYFNSKQPFTCTIIGMKNLIGGLATQESVNEVSTRLDQTAEQVNGVNYPFVFNADPSGWKITNGYVQSYTPSSGKRSTQPVTIEEGDLILYRLCDGNTPHASLVYTPLIITDANGKVLVASALSGEEDEIIAPSGAKYLYTTQGTELVDPYVRIIKKVPDSIRKYLPRVYGAFVNIGLSASDFTGGQIGNITTYYGRPLASATRIKSGYYEIAPGHRITFTISANRVQFTFYDKNRIAVSQSQSYTAGATIDIPDNVCFMRITILEPSGTSIVPTFEDTGLVVYTNSVELAPCEAISDSYVPISAPSPQLPADDSSDADFDADTITPAQLYDAFDNLLEELSAPNGNNVLNPKYGTRYSKTGRDASNTFDIFAYVFTNRDRFGWKYADALYAWVNGSTIVYTDSISPLVGGVIYSDANRTDSGNTITSFDVANMAFTGSNNVVYTRSRDNDVSADVVYTKEAMKVVPTTQNMNIFAKDDVFIGPAAITDTTHLTRSGKTYTRCEDFDFHHAQKGTIYIWANEHGPWGDPAECAIVLYRLAKDLCGGCRNNQFILWLKRNYKIVLVPCANPYGLESHTRVNANGVNLNRNYCTPGWVNETSEPKGNYAGDQPETQFIMNTAMVFEPKVSVDIHCLGNQDRTNVGTTQQIGFIPSDFLLNEAKRTMLGYSVQLSDGRTADPTASSQGEDWLYYQGFPGGLIEMNGGAPALNEDGINTRNSALVMEADYTLLLVMIRVWLAGSEPSLNLGKIGLL